MRKDWLLFIDIVLLMAIGLTTLISTVIGSESLLTGGGVVNKQLIFIIVGLTAYFCVSYFDFRFTAHPQVLLPVYLVILASLIALLFFGVEINNAKRWILIGGIQIQPSEFMKLVLILVNAWIFTRRKRYNVYLLAGLSFIVTVIPVFFIFKEPDAGTAIVMMGFWAAMVFFIIPDQVRTLLVVSTVILGIIAVNLFLSGLLVGGAVTALVLLTVALFLIILRKVPVVLAVIILGASVLLGFGARYMWNDVLGQYQRDRIEVFLNPEAHLQDKGFQVDQSKVAIGSGMLYGKGFGHGTQSKLQFLPEHQTDFAFAAFAEEFGLVGVLTLFVLYAFLLVRILATALTATDEYGTLICIGLASKLLIEVCINVGMNLGVTPATGVPLPLISAGGSIMLMTLVGLGMVQSVRLHREIES
ncbi:MAG: FtsW/RodA/SpoVE family cell cycle protein [Candidatus Dojkabacteria bacterium]|nr:FtsW/RodA/SpoVE family cell cycle protein [Candidatus Dojkabacteria bacterium]